LDKLTLLDTHGATSIQGGGGGYIPNIIFNPSQQNLVYARTDIGGAYKWNSTTNLWVPLDGLGTTWANWNSWAWRV
jgi:xyloglucan-specific exo-beta-1,4-glucanase